MDKYLESRDFILSKTANFKPEIAVVLGSGLGGFVDKIDIKYSLNYSEIPNFPISTVKGHAGKLILGYVENRAVVVMQGRFHYYEGYSAEQSIFPIRIMRLLGASTLLLSNAAGAINPSYNVGDIVIIENHINFIPNPLIGPNKECFGVRFPDMKQPYSKDLMQKAQSIMPLKQGVYVATTGPSMETKSEINYFRVIGGDLVGMSTAPEVIAAVHCAMRVFGVSVVTNVTSKETSHEEVVCQGNRASERMSELFTKLIDIC